jgi:hypothetical protein
MAYLKYCYHSLNHRNPLIPRVISTRLLRRPCALLSTRVDEKPFLMFVGLWCPVTEQIIEDDEGEKSRHTVVSDCHNPVVTVKLASATSKTSTSPCDVCCKASKVARWAANANHTPDIHADSCISLGTAPPRMQTTVIELSVGCCASRLYVSLPLVEPSRHEGLHSIMIPCVMVVS